jgi:uncharacterized protein (TIGR03000 family)
MYSLVLMAAMTGGPDTSGADILGPAVSAVTSAPLTVGCIGCGGCTGYYSSCSGSCYGSCHGRGGFLGHKHSCHGCCGGYATSYGCCGGYASCHGCCGGGGFLGHKHHARHGCCGGYSCFGCSGGYAAGCWGSCSGYGCLGGVYGTYTTPVYPTYGMPGAPGVVPPIVVPSATPAPKTDTNPAPKTEKKGSRTSASLKFKLPADAVLFVDGQKTAGEGTERAFYTPPLAGGKFFYDVRAEMVIDGKAVTEEKRVVVQAGDQLTEAFPKLFAAAEAKTQVAGK